METEAKTNGALVGLIIIIVILAIGGIYMWQKNIQNTPPVDNTSLETSDDTTANIEAELENVDVDSLDSDL